MARVAQPKHVIAQAAVDYIRTELRSGLSDFIEELDTESKLDSTYVAGRDGAAKAHIDSSIKMLRWIYETEFGLTPPSPFTNTEIDAIDPDFRTFDDGL